MWSLLVAEALGDRFVQASVRAVGGFVVVVINAVRDGLGDLVDIVDLESIEQREDTMGLVKVVMYCYST